MGRGIRRGRLPGLHRRAKLLWSLAVGLVVSAGVVPPVLGAVTKQPARRHAPAPLLVFGIYPGGGAGTVGPSGQTVPEDGAKRVAALERLRASGRPFVVHLYAGYTGPGSLSASAQVGTDIAQYTAAGFQVELVLTYRPADRVPATDVPGFAAFARGAVQSFGANPGFVSLQVTNEANVRTAPNAADGFYPGVVDALVRGVTAAKAAASTAGFAQVAVGFNWAFSLAASETGFWRTLGKRGGGAFGRSLDWVGLDVYPGTWGPRVPGGDLAVTAAKTVVDSLAALRRNMALAGLPATLPLHISENGYPTGPARTDAMQVAVMKSTIATVDEYRAKYAVTDYRWFDLRDADSSSAGFEGRYGLLRDDYTPKPAFDVYRSLVATLGSA
jgi:hypothetical protein